MKTAHLLLALALVASFSGCGLVVMTCHNAAEWTTRQWTAEKAWRERKWMYADLPCRGSFKAGFKSGYRFANGGYDSCEPPQLRHYWRISKLTASERQNARAWSDGFTHGTVAAQQDNAVGSSEFETAAMQPPPGVPDLRYLNPPEANAMDQTENFPFAPSMAPPNPYEPPPTGNIGNPPMMTPPPPAPAAEGVPQNLSLPPAVLPAPGQMPGPGRMPAPSAQLPPGLAPMSEAAPAIGNLRSIIGLQPAPAAEPARTPFVPQQPASPPGQTMQAADWQLPIIRD